MCVIWYAIKVGEYSDIVSCWSKDGTSFAVKDPQLFTSRAVKFLLQMPKFDSFTRKLGRWGFAKKRDKVSEIVLHEGRLDSSLPVPFLNLCLILLRYRDEILSSAELRWYPIQR